MAGSVKLLTPSGGSVTINATDTASALSLTLPATNDNIITANTTQTLTNKTLTNPVINGFTGNTSAITIGTTQFVKDASGNIGIGTASPSYKLHVATGSLTLNGADNSVVTLRSGASTYLNVLQSYTSTFLGTKIVSTDALSFGTSNTDRLFIDISGNLGIGTTSPLMKLHIYSTTAQNDTYGFVQVENTSAANTVNAGYTTKNWSGTSQFMQWENNGLRIGSRILANYGQGNIYFTTGSDSVKATLYNTGGHFSAAGNLHTNRGRLAFSSTATDSNHCIYNNYLNLDGEGSWDGMKMNVFAGLNVRIGNASGATPTTAMLIDGSGNLTISGATATKASGTTWANPSDTRLKDNQQLYTKGLDEILQVVVKTWEFNGKGGSAKGAKGLGVIADEIEFVLPESVDTYSAKLNDEDDDETEIKRFDASEVIWLLVNSVKELSAQNKALEDRLAKLEAK